MRRIGVEVAADTVSLTAGLGEASKAVTRFGSLYTGEFDKMSTSTLKLTAAQDKLAVSLAKVPAGSTAAAQAMVRYRGEIDSLRASQLAAAKEIGSAMTRYITAPTILVGAAAVDLAVKFQAAMTRIQTQAGASAREVRNLTGQVLELAKSGAQQGPEQLAEGLYHLESLGLRGAKAMNALKVSSDAAALGTASLADVTTALGGVIVTGIKGSSDFQKTMGTLNATIGAGNLTMNDLVGFLGTGVVPSAKAAGISLTELGAALAVMTDRGIPAEQAGTRLRMTLALLQNQTPKAAKALGALGIDSSTLATTLRKPNGLLMVLQMLQAGIESVGKVQGNKDLLAAFGGGRSGSAIQTLVASLDSSVSSFGGKAAQIAATSSRLSRQEAAQQKTAAAQFHRDIAKMEADLIGLGDAILPTVTKVVNGVTGIADAFAKLPGPIKTDMGALLGVFAVGGPLLLGVLTVSKAVRAMGGAFEAMAGKAGTAIAATDAEMATMAATSATTAGEIEASNAAAGASFARILGGAAAAVGLGILDYQLGKKALTTQGAGYFAAGSKKSPYPKGTESDDYYQAALAGMAHPPNLPPPPAHGPHAAAYLLGQTQRGANLTSPAAMRNYPEGVGAAGFASLAAAGVSHGQLSKAQNLALALAADPTNPKLLAEKRQMDQSLLASLRKRFAAGKINATQFYNAALPVETDIGTDTSKQASAASKAATAARKAAAAKAKQQREYAAGIANHAAELRNTAERLSTLPAAGGKPSGKMIGADDALVRYYKQEEKDAKLTAAERQHYAALAIAVRKKETSETQRAASEYLRVMVANAKASIDAAKATAGPGDDIAALNRLIAVYETATRNHSLSPTERASARESLAAARTQRANLRNNPQTPIGLQLAAAKAGTTITTADDIHVAAEIKKWDERLLRSHKLSIQGQIAVYNDIAQQNSVLGELLTRAHAKAISTRALTAGLDLTPGQRKALESRLSVAQAFSGHVPTTTGVLGVSTPIVNVGVIHVRTDDAHQLADSLGKLGRSKPVQTSGPNAGRSRALP